jgi:hypothetical protein
MTERLQSELPEHERRAETEVGAGITGQGGTAPETGEDRRAREAGLDERPDQPMSDVADDDPEDPNGPEAAYTPRSI